MRLEIVSCVEEWPARCVCPIHRSSLPFAIHLIPLGVAFDKIHAQQAPAGLRLGLGFDEVEEELEQVHEEGKNFVHE